MSLSDTEVHVVVSFILARSIPLTKILKFVAPTVAGVPVLTIAMWFHTPLGISTVELRAAEFLTRKLLFDISIFQVALKTLAKLVLVAFAQNSIVKGVVAVNPKTLGLQPKEVFLFLVDDSYQAL